MTFTEAINRRNQLELNNKVYRQELKTLSGNTGLMGLTPDSVKASIEYKEIKAKLDSNFKELQTLNIFINKRFPNELKASRKAK